MRDGSNIVPAIFCNASPLSVIYTARVTDSALRSASQPLSITIHPTPPGVPIATEIAESIVEHGGKATPVPREQATGAKKLLAGIWADHRKLGSLAYQMDGAADNGAGSVVAMEAVRILKALDIHPRRTIRIALWSGEEQGLLGSIAYVKAHFGTAEEPGPEFAKFNGYLNIDTGTGRLRGASVFGPPETAAALREIDVTRIFIDPQIDAASGDVHGAILRLEGLN